MYSLTSGLVYTFSVYFLAICTIYFKLNSCNCRQSSNFPRKTKCEQSKVLLNWFDLWWCSRCRLTAFRVPWAQLTVCVNFHMFSTSLLGFSLGSPVSSKECYAVNYPGCQQKNRHTSNQLRCHFMECHRISSKCSKGMFTKVSGFVISVKFDILAIKLKMVLVNHTGKDRLQS